MLSETQTVERAEAEQIILSLYKYCLKRTPEPQEFDQWTDAVVRGTPLSRIIESFGTSVEYRDKQGVAVCFPPGHYYSPIVNPSDDVRVYMEAQERRIGASPPGINMMREHMKAFFVENAGFMASASFTSGPSAKHRYYYDNGVYPLGDAVTLRTMLEFLRPARIVEIGSGFSTACMLDTVDELGLPTRITCIEPYPSRLRSLLRGGDRVEILESPVQRVGLDRFAELQARDILFIDSTHVLKTGSDVHYELFEILPCLKPGVMVHFHDVPYPFEYSTEWVFGTNYSWNEAYAVRAFLMYNRQFVPFYSNSLIAQLEPALVRSLYPDFPSNPGTHLWIRRQK